MRAAVFHGPGQPLTLETVRIAPLAAHQVLVKLAYSGVCHSDYHVVKGEWTQPTPMVLGHEAAGVIEAVGDGVASLQVGDHVILSWAPSCGDCFYCHSDQPELCERALVTALERGTGLDGTSPLSMGDQPVACYLAVGSFAEYVVASERGAIKIRPDMPLDRAALIGCAVATGVGAVTNTAKVPVGSTVLVIGCGGVGLSVIMGASLVSATTIIAADVHDSKLAVARRLGATHLVNVGSGDLVDVVRVITAGRGVDYAFEAIGRSASIEEAFEATRPGGMTVVVGIAPEGHTITIDAYSLADRQKTIRGSAYGSTRPAIDFPKLVDLYMSGKLDLDALVGETTDLDHVNDAFEEMGRGESVRTLIKL